MKTQRMAMGIMVGLMIIITTTTMEVIIITFKMH